MTNEVFPCYDWLSISFSQLINVTCWTINATKNKCLPVCPAWCGRAAPVCAPSSSVSNSFPPNKHPATLTFRLPPVTRSGCIHVSLCPLCLTSQHMAAIRQRVQPLGPTEPQALCQSVVETALAPHTHQNPYWQCGAVGRMLMVPCSVYRLLQRSSSDHSAGSISGADPLLRRN